MKYFKRALGIILSATFVLTCGGCGKLNTETQQQGNAQQEQNKANGENAEATATQFPGMNDKREFRLLHNWTREGIANHFHGGTAIGPLEWFSVEGLMQYVRTVDTIYNTNAESVVHNEDGTTTINIRKESKWHNGDDFVADDVLAFWYLNHTSLVNNISNMEKVDDKTIVLTWKPGREPNEQIKSLLIAQDKVATVQYKEFAEYVDIAKNILEGCEDAPADDTGWAPLGKIIDENANGELNKNYADFKSHNPSWFVATGPFILDKMSETQMILKKNENYWAADNIGFDVIRCTNGMSDLNQVYNQIAAGDIDYQDGLAPVDTIDNILEKNPNIAHYKMADPGAIGLVFNLEKKVWKDEVREAFQYIFDRDEMRKAGNFYGMTTWTSMLAMAPSDVTKWVSEENRALITQYSYNTQKAEELLTKAGWTKGSDGKWMENGKPVVLTLGYDGGHPGMSGVAEAASSALNNFGIEIQLKKGQDWSTWWEEVQKTDSSYDLVVNWTDLNMSFSYPGGSFVYMYTDINSKVLHLERDTTGQLTLELDKADGTGTFRVSDVYNDLYYIKDDAELSAKVADLVVGLSKKNYGIPFYQNVTGSFLNLGMIKGAPYEEKLMENRNLTYVPEGGTEEANKVAEMNFHFAHAATFIYGILEPNVP